jgi:hypothetical protein
MTADEALRMLAGSYARYRRGEVSDRVAHVEAVVIDRRLTVIAADSGAPGHRSGRIHRGGRFHQPQFLDVIVIREWDPDPEPAAAEAGLDFDALEGDVMRRGMLGEIAEATIKRELFILKTMKKALDMGTAAPAGEVIIYHSDIPDEDQPEALTT